MFDVTGSQAQGIGLAYVLGFKLGLEYDEAMNPYESKKIPHPYPVLHQAWQSGFFDGRDLSNSGN